jgi:hypothetical protein
MDPNETLKIMRDATLPIAERAEAAEALLGWIRSGGYLPITGYGFGGNTATKFVLIEECNVLVREAAKKTEIEAHSRSRQGMWDRARQLLDAPEAL